MHDMKLVLVMSLALLLGGVLLLRKSPSVETPAEEAVAAR
jgi:hypothetical protein